MWPSIQTECHSLDLSLVSLHAHKLKCLYSHTIEYFNKLRLFFFPAMHPSRDLACPVQIH